MIENWSQAYKTANAIEIYEPVNFYSGFVQLLFLYFICTAFEKNLLYAL